MCCFHFQPACIIGSSQRSSRSIPKHERMLVALQTGSIFILWLLFRLENQKLKELVTGGASAATAGSASAPAGAEAAEAKEEPVKVESPAVRPKMEVSTPQKVGEMVLFNKLLGVFTANSTCLVKVPRLNYSQNV